MRNLDFCRMIETENHPSVVHFVPDSSLEKGAVVLWIAYGEFTERMVTNNRVLCARQLPHEPAGIV